jgi:hypothetical protein
MLEPVFLDVIGRHHPTIEYGQALGCACKQDCEGWDAWRTHLAAELADRFRVAGCMTHRGVIVHDKDSHGPLSKTVYMVW